MKKTQLASNHILTPIIDFLKGFIHGWDKLAEFTQKRVGATKEM